MVFPATIPLPARSVLLNNIEFRYVEGTYRVQMAPTFGQKLSIGDPKYADLDFDVSAHAITHLTAGYGLRRYSDMPPRDPRREQCYRESSDVDCRGLPIVLGPLQTAQTLTGILATPVWGGEYVPTTGANAGTRFFVAVAGTKVWRSTDLATWTDTGLALPGTPLQGAVGVYGGKLLFGFGAAFVARFTTDLATLGNVTQTGAVNIFVFTFTADRANTYIAGGDLSTEGHKVLSSNDQTTATFLFDTTSEVVCGKLDTKITALAPGGGIDVVMVGKEDEFGAILPQSPAVYTILVPLDSFSPTNCLGARWWMGVAGPMGDEQRGPMIVVFPRERSLWAYQPSTQMSGTASNISPWADMNHRPDTIRGRITAIQGTARWLYYAVTNNAGNTWIIARDARTGANHPIINLGVNACTMLALSTLGVTNPRLVIGKGNGLVTVILPLDGESTADDPAARFAASGVLTLPDIDLNLPAEEKISYSVLVAADNIAAGRTILVEASYDSGAYFTVGTVDVSPSKELDFAPPTSAKRIGLRLTFSTNNAAESPKLLAVVLRVSINAKLYRIWQFQAPMPAGSLGTLTDDLKNPYSEISNFWTYCARGTPVTFRDRWNDSYTVRIKSIAEVESFREELRSPETMLEFALLATQAVPLTPSVGVIAPWVLGASELGTTTVVG